MPLFFGKAMFAYEITTDPTRFDLDAIHAFLAQTYWSPGIPREIVERSIANSLCFALRCDGEQIGFARAVTDRATFAYLADVFIVESHRGKGLARRLLDAVFGHPDLQGLRRLLLATRDAHGLYSRYGFTALGTPQRMMEIARPGIYLKTG